MAGDLRQVFETARRGFAAQSIELTRTQAQQAHAVTTATATGTGDMDETFKLDCGFRLVFVRCHFAGGAGTAPLALSLDSAGGSAFDVRLFTVTLAGGGKDVNLRISATDSIEPSPWTFRSGDALRITWTNPDSGNMTWGLEVGLALAS